MLTTLHRRASVTFAALIVSAGLVVAGSPAQAVDDSTGWISGRVTDTNLTGEGDPIVGVPVVAYQFDDSTDTFEPVPGSATVTVANGEYLIEELDPGTYRICFGAPRQITALKYVSQCYQQDYLVEDAQNVVVEAGEVTEGIDDSLLPAFTDVALPDGVVEGEPVGGHPFWLEITFMGLYGITTGYDEVDGSKTFRPGQPVLREQMAAFLYRLEKLYGDGSEPEVDIPASSPFTDVAPTDVFYREILWLEQSGITTGYDEPGGTRTFRPSQPVLREQMAAFLYRFDRSEFVDDDGPEFTDVTAQNNVFFDEIEWMEFEEITTGYDEGNGTRTYRPAEPVLREQMAAFIIRYTELDQGGGDQG
ncbi:hypothetical protein HMPREF0063_10484 [Aeromicrobium marinum DSM 15272]|uniref:SLH domain-containing protein n=1 Tax=Aeromicrobium marinum DSM 15272 TaxID=585531 RepID=E2S8X6_9ACTN|nr:S-layer homology domain-containing protein [Aeromicrobium marinum]EFQ84631.1 hypothetical protein HMPREF0063_10484 [Aeromicrobium marinum DSM 15272]